MPYTEQAYPTSFGNGAADSTLNGSITSGATSLIVNTLPPGVTAAPFTIGIDSAGVREWIYVGAIGGTGNKTWSSLIRGFAGSTPAAHSNADDVRLEVTGDDLIALLTGRTHKPNELLVGGNWNLTGPLSVSVTANQNDWAPTGFSTASHIVATPTANRTITGMAAPSEEGRRVPIVNESATYSLTFPDQDAGSIAANRYALGINFVLGPKQAAEFLYDNGLGRWLLIAGVGSSLVDHTHESSGGQGGLLDEDALALSDVTTNDVSTAQHGFVPKGTGTGKFLRDDGTWADLPTGADNFVLYTGGNITAPTGGFAELSSSLRITVDAAVGDKIEVGLNGLAIPGVASIYAFDIATIVSGSIQNRFAGGSDGAAGWLSDVAVASKHELTGSLWYTVQSGDIVSGQVTVSLVGNRVSGATAGTVSATATDPLLIYARVGPGNRASSGALVLLEQHAASSSAQLDFASFISPTYDEYLIELIEIVPATNGANLQLLVGTGGGPTYDTGASYEWMYSRVSSGGSGFDSGNTGQTSITLAEGISSSDCVNGSYRAFNLQSTANKKRFMGDIVLVQNDSTFYRAMFGGQWTTAGTAATALRFNMSSGNIASGTIRIYGVAK